MPHNVSQSIKVLYYNLRKLRKLQNGTLQLMTSINYRKGY